MENWWLTVITLLFCVLGQGAAKQDSCTHTQLLLDEKGKPVRLGTKETEERIVYCERAKLPGTYDGQGIVPIMVLIDPEGKVSCARALRGDSEMKKYAVDAVKKWTFKPVEKDGKAVAIYGFVSVRVSWDKSYGRDSCDK